jgi:predicted CxxxxCH...CXXCH cytochrome family protein
VRNTCTACHQGAGTQTAKHFDGVTDVVLSASFQAKTGVLAYSSTARTCGAVSCHGGQTTPTWLTGTIDVNVNAGCRSCHVSGTTQYNSYSSGRHGTHSSRSCTDCHDTVLLAPSHFSGLATSAFEQTARSTIKASLNYNGSTCSPSCHGNESWR